MKTTLLLFAILWGSLFYGQDYRPLLAPDNYWVYSAFSIDFETYDMHYYDYQIRMTDEIITHNGKSYIGLEQRSRYRIDNIPQTNWGAWETIPVYLSENTADKKVFIYYAEEYLWHEAGEFLLYDFGMQIGDFMTFEGFIGGEDVEPAEITDITYEMVYGLYVKTFHFENQSDFMFSVYEGIGSTHGLFTSSFIWDVGWELTDFGQNLSTSDSNYSKSKIYPNPFKNQIHIETEKPIQNLKIFDVNGKLILIKKSVAELNSNLTQLEKGIYILEITHSNQEKETIKMIKK